MKSTDMRKKRRAFIKTGMAMGTGLILNPWQLSANIENTDIRKTVRIGFVGVGGRGFGLIKGLLKLGSVEITAICDIDQNNIGRAVKHIQQAGFKKPKIYDRNDTDYKRLCDHNGLDLVMTATPWDLHTPVCVAAMKAGKNAATEVPAAVTKEECWQLVETSEQTGKFCTMLENVSYWRNVMTISKMINKGVFGDVLHAQVGYQHDIRPGRFNDRTLKTFNETGEAHWRIKQHETGEGNLYPTHALGPVAQWMDINRGDKFSYLVSMSTPSMGLNIYAARKFGKEHPLAKKSYAHGDINTTLIKTEKGRTITLYHDCATYRPYHLNLRLQGTEGIYTDSQGIFVNGLSAEEGEWDCFKTAEYVKEHKPKLWEEQGDLAKKGGHGGGDYLELHRLMEAVRSGTPPDIDVYDAASWSVVTDLSGKSVREGSKPIEFPDFTKGAWKTRTSENLIFVQ